MALNYVSFLEKKKKSPLVSDSHLIHSTVYLPFIRFKMLQHPFSYKLHSWTCQVFSFRNSPSFSLENNPTTFSLFFNIHHLRLIHLLISLPHSSHVFLFLFLMWRTTGVPSIKCNKNCTNLQLLKYPPLSFFSLSISFLHLSFLRTFLAPFPS